MTSRMPSARVTTSRVLGFTALTVLLFGGIPAVAEQNVNPRINDSYQDPDVRQWVGVFERDGREVWDRRLDILRNLRLKPGLSVADVGAGTGFFSALMADEVGPGGVVYAVDVVPDFVEASVRRAAERGLNNVVGIVNSQKDVGLESASVDLVFISDTYHHFEYPLTTLASIHDALRPGGELVVIDFKREPGFSSNWVLGHVRAGEAQVRAEIESSGFDLVERLDFMQTQYYLRFRRR